MSEWANFGGNPGAGSGSENKVQIHTLHPNTIPHCIVTVLLRMVVTGLVLEDLR